jgi:hypothetical protein
MAEKQENERGRNGVEVRERKIEKEIRKIRKKERNANEINKIKCCFKRNKRKRKHHDT